MILPSLQISLSDDPTLARLRARAGTEADLTRLATSFRTARFKSYGVVDIAIEDLLLNLAALSDWSEPQTVAWDDELAALVRDTVSDANSLASRIDERGQSALYDLGPDDLLAALGPGWKGPLTAYQRRDIARLLSLRHGANFSVPGAGKTRVGLAVFEAERAAGVVERLLVVGPKSCYEAWEEENDLCLNDPLDLQILDREVGPTTSALLVNYERLQSSLPGLLRWLAARPSMLILDEAHRMKLGADGVYGAACMAMGPRARRRLILTGTPAPNGVKDLENLLGFVWPGHGRQTVVRAVSGGSLAHASEVLRPLFTRTTKKELGLPPVTIVQRQLDMPPLHQDIYDGLIGMYSKRSGSSEADLEAIGKIAVYLLMAAISPALIAVGTTKYEPLAYRVPPLAIPDGSALTDLMRDLPNYEMAPKYREVLAIVAENAALGRKTLVWSTFVRSVTTLERILKEFHPAVVYGGTKDREEQILRFRRSSDCMVMLSNPATLGEGISLHRECHDAVYVDRDFAAGRFLQSLDRIHRLGLDPGVSTRVTILSTAGTIDEVVNQRLGQKLEFMGSVLDDSSVRQLADLDEEPAVGGGLDQRDMQALMGHLRGSSA